jgi:energy-converting hydrogenase Eha subunit A
LYDFDRNTNRKEIKLVATRNWYLHPVIATAIGINTVILVLALARSGADSAPLWNLLEEDRIVEWMQFLCFAVMAVLLGFIAVDRSTRLPRLSWEVAGIAGVSVLVALAALEEISWFQRVLGVETPDFFRQHNRQSETNLHNLALGGASLHKAVLVKLIFIIGIMHNLVLPLIARSRPAIRRYLESIGLYLPPLPAALAYLLLVLLSHILIDHPRKGELGEMFGAVHYLSTVFTAYLVGIGYGGPTVIENQADSRRISVLFAMFMVFLLFVSWLLGSTFVPPSS